MPYSRYTRSSDRYRYKQFACWYKSRSKCCCRLLVMYTKDRFYLLRICILGISRIALKNICAVITGILQFVIAVGKACRVQSHITVSRKTSAHPNASVPVKLKRKMIADFARFYRKIVLRPVKQIVLIDCFCPANTRPVHIDLKVGGTSARTASATRCRSAVCKAFCGSITRRCKYRFRRTRYRKCSAHKCAEHKKQQERHKKFVSCLGFHKIISF